MKRKVIKNPKGVKKINPRRKPIYVVKWEYGEQHFTDRKDAELYAKLLKGKGRNVTVSEKKRNTAKPVAKRVSNPTVSKTCKTHKQAEQFQNRLYNKYDYVRLIKAPQTTWEGIYVWEVKSPIVKKNTAKPVAKNPYLAGRYVHPQAETNIKVHLSNYARLTPKAKREQKEFIIEYLRRILGVSAVEARRFLTNFLREKTRNTAKPVAKANVARKANPNKYTVKWWVGSNYKHQSKTFTVKKDAVDFFNRLTRSTKSIHGGVWDRNYGGYILEKLRKNPVRNSSRQMFNAEKLNEITREFQGVEPNGRRIHTVGSDYSPSTLARLGKAVLAIIKNGKQKVQIDFGPKAWVAADARRNLYIEGSDAAIKNIALPKKGELLWLGQIEQLDYIANKAHIENNETVHFYHKLGECDGVKPNGFVDSDGYILIIGGGYDILPEGIAN